MAIEAKKVATRSLLAAGVLAAGYGLLANHNLVLSETHNLFQTGLGNLHPETYAFLGGVSDILAVSTYFAFKNQINRFQAKHPQPIVTEEPRVFVTDDDAPPYRVRVRGPLTWL